jgi:hypothetical protein
LKLSHGGHSLSEAQFQRVLSAAPFDRAQLRRPPRAQDGAAAVVVGQSTARNEVDYQEGSGFGVGAATKALSGDVGVQGGASEA